MSAPIQKQADQSSQTKEFTGRHMLYVILGFFGTIIAANATLAFFATGSWTGLIVKNSYVASQEYNDVLDAAESQQALGWTSTAVYQDGIFYFDLRDQNGQPLHELDVTGVVARPIHEHDDMALSFTYRRGGGPYEAAADLAPGVWVLDVDAQRADGMIYKQSFRLWVDEHG